VKVQIADDVAAVRRILALMVSELRPYVDEVLQAENGEAVKKAAAAAGADLAVVVADWDLPGLPGARIGAELREICGRDVGVLVCINPGQQADVSKASPGAVHDFAVRPFTQDELRDKLMSLLTRKPESEAPPKPLAPAPAPPPAPPPAPSAPLVDLGLPFFLELPSALMKDFLELATSVHHSAGAVLLAAGRKVEALNVVSSGVVEVVNPDGSAGDTIDSGNCFGEHAFLSGEAAPFTVKARTKVEVVSLHRSRLAELLRRQPEMSRYLDLLSARRRGASAPSASADKPAGKPATPPAPAPPPAAPAGEASLEDLFGK
jgi:CheY-like chemotaxis protein